jgi:hypothetical protein
LFFDQNYLYHKVELGKRGGGSYGFKRISNFKINFLQHIADSKVPRRLVHVVNEAGEEKIFEAPASAFTSLTRFKEVVEGHGNYVFRGVAEQYDNLKEYLMASMGNGRLIDILGQQPEGFFAYSNAALTPDRGVVFYDENGCFEYNNQVFYVPSGNQLYLNDPWAYAPQKSFRYVEASITWDQFVLQLRKVHREHAITALLYGCATAFSEHIYQQHHGFPVMFLYGEPSTGKGQLIKAIQTLLGKPQAPLTITGKANTDKGKIRSLAQFVNGQIMFDEFSNKLPKEGIEFLKGIWDRTGYTRGNIDSHIGIDTIPITSSVWITGNEYPLDEALVTRLVVEEMNRNTFTEEEKRDFNTLKEWMENGYSSLYETIFNIRDEFVRIYKTEYYKCRKEIDKHFAGADITDRQLLNIAVLYTTHVILVGAGINMPFTKSEVFNHLVKLVGVQNDKKEVGSEVQKFWDAFLVGVRNRQIRFNREYTLDGKELTMFFRPVHNVYLATHIQLFREAGLSRSTMLDKIRKSKAYMDFRSSHRIGKVVSSALVINTQEVEAEFTQDLIAAGTTHDLSEIEPPTSAPSSEKQSDTPF